MKNLFITSVLLTFCFSGISQTTYTLEAYDHYFSPDTLYVQVGDTIELDVITGYHNAVEVDSIDWVNEVNNPNGGFNAGLGEPVKFTISTPGTYYNICGPHVGMGMKSIIIVNPGPLSVENEKPAQEIRFFPNPASETITTNNANKISIYSITGELVFAKMNLKSSEVIDISSLTKGVYFIVLDNRTEKLIVN
ncbi:MAG: T9SS type A sorting domain-containing protein [Crocinitomicaceae bacterium]|nr:T9SS type A sorting domain-containing protein [Crocinitomicaceae bacterium]